MTEYREHKWMDNLKGLIATGIFIGVAVWQFNIGRRDDYFDWEYMWLAIVMAFLSSFLGAILFFGNSKAKKNKGQNTSGLLLSLFQVLIFIAFIIIIILFIVFLVQISRPNSMG